MNVPWGVLLLRKLTNKCCPRLHFNRDLCYKSSVLILTYVAYMCYHMSRKPISVVKAVLHRNCTNLKPPDGLQPTNNETWCDWAPFNGSDSNAAQLLGELDSAFLFSYAIAMFASGFLAERANLRYFLSLGMLFSGIFSYLFGIAKTYGIHDLTYYIFVQIMAGVSQTTGWPGVVTVVSNWCGKGKRGLIFGIWNSHTSIGNILGSLIAAAYVETDWSMSFIMPGLIMGVAGFVIFLFLVVHPNDVGCVPPERDSADANKTRVELTESSPLLQDLSERRKRAIGFFDAFRIPGVIDVSLSHFWFNIVISTFYSWLPVYIGVIEPTIGAKFSGIIATIFSVGCIFGSISVGAVSDQTKMKATVCVFTSFVATVLLFVHRYIGTSSSIFHVFYLFSLGFFMNCPITVLLTVVTYDLGNHGDFQGKTKAMATVSAIIYGTGMIGGGVGPILAGFLIGYGWHYVIVMLTVSTLLGLVSLLRLAWHEINSAS